MSNILELAGKFNTEQQAKQQVEADQERREVDTALDKIRVNFEQNFADELPILREQGITWQACLQKYPYFHEGVYIEFTHAGNKLKMDYSNDQWRYEFVQRNNSSPNPRYGTMTFGKWPKDRFFAFLADNLLSKPPKTEESNDHEAY